MKTQILSFGERVSFEGLEARWAATVDPVAVQKAAKGSKPYTVFTPEKTQKMVYAKSQAVYELVDPDGHIYVLQAHGEEFPLESLAQLGDRMKMRPKGWQYRTRILIEDLVLDFGPGQTIYAIGDEFHQYYTRIPKTT